MSNTIIKLADGKYKLKTDDGYTKTGNASWAANMCEIYDIKPVYSEIIREFRKRVKNYMMDSSDLKRLLRKLR